MAVGLFDLSVLNPCAGELELGSKSDWGVLTEDGEERRTIWLIKPVP